MCQYKTAGAGSRLTDHGWGAPIMTHLVSSGVRRLQVGMRGCQSEVKGMRYKLEGMLKTCDTLLVSSKRLLADDPL
jgi:hypothetical protein